MANKGIQAKAYELTFKFKLCQQKDTDKTKVNIYYNLTLENKRYIAHAVCI